MIKKILFPVDFSPSCVAMAPYVKRAADMFGSRVTLMHVCDLASHNGFELYVRPLQEIADEHWDIARAKLEAFLTTEFSPATSSRVLCSGDPAAQIADLAQAKGFDLVMMPTHAGRFRRMLLGSTTAKVLDDASCFVLTTEHAETQSPRSFEHRVWMCAIGLSEDSERVLRLASAAAAEAGARLLLMHVAEAGSETDAYRRLDELQEIVGSQAIACVTAGSVKESVLDAARRSSADALIIGRALQTSGLGRMRDLAYGLVRDSPFPVLSV